MNDSGSNHLVVYGSGGGWARLMRWAWVGTNQPHALHIRAQGSFACNALEEKTPITQAAKGGVAFSDIGILKTLIGGARPVCCCTATIAMCRRVHKLG